MTNMQKTILYEDILCENWKTRARVTPRADKALTPDIFYD